MLYGGYDTFEQYQASPDYKKWKRSGHKPKEGESEDVPCNHENWTWEKHGRVCPCGVWIVDIGD